MKFLGYLFSLFGLGHGVSKAFLARGSFALLTIAALAFAVGCSSDDDDEETKEEKCKKDDKKEWKDGKCVDKKKETVDDKTDTDDSKDTGLSFSEFTAIYKKTDLTLTLEFTFSRELKGDTTGALVVAKFGTDAAAVTTLEGSEASFDGKKLTLMLKDKKKGLKAALGSDSVPTTVTVKVTKKNAKVSDLTTDLELTDGALAYFAKMALDKDSDTYKYSGTDPDKDAFDKKATKFAKELEKAFTKTDSATGT